MSIPIQGLAPLLNVFDMPRSLAFYRDILGFEVVSTNGPALLDEYDWVLLNRGTAVLMLNTMYESDHRPATPPEDRVLAHRDTGLYFGCPDVDAAYQHFLENGITVKPPKVAHYGMKQLYLQDPDGYELCFQWETEDA